MTTEHSLLKGSLAMTIAAFFMACFGAFLKAAALSLPVFLVVFLFYFFAAWIIGIIIILPKKLSFLKTDHFWKHVGRAFFGTMATCLYVFAMRKIILLNATLLFNTTPLFVPILATFMLKKKPSWKIWPAILIGFLGVIFILNPTTEVLYEIVGDLLGLLSGFFLALAFIFIKMLTQENEPPYRIIFYFFFLGALFLTPFLFVYWQTPSIDSIFFTLLGALTFVFSQIFIVKAYSYDDPSSVGPFLFFSVIFAGIIEWIFWKKVPYITDLIGTALVILGGASALLFSKPKKI